MVINIRFPNTITVVITLVYLMMLLVQIIMFTGFISESQFDQDARIEIR